VGEKKNKTENLFSATFYDSKDNSVGITTDYELEGLDLIPGGARFVFFPQSPDLIWAHPAS
jgi:hypothetical protein